MKEKTIVLVSYHKLLMSKIISEEQFRQIVLSEDLETTESLLEDYEYRKELSEIMTEMNRYKLAEPSAVLLKAFERLSKYLTDQYVLNQASKIYEEIYVRREKLNALLKPRGGHILLQIRPDWNSIYKGEKEASKISSTSGGHVTTED